MAQWWDSDPVYEPPPAQSSDGQWWANDPVYEPPQQQPSDGQWWTNDPIAEEKQQQAPPEPEAEGTIGHLVRTAAHTALPSAAGLAGIPAGIAAGAALGLPAGGFGAIPGGIIGGIAGYVGGSKLQETALKAMGFDDSQQQAVNARTNPKTQLAGEILGALPTVGVGAGVSAAVRAGGALGGGLLEAGSQALGDEPWDPTRIGGATVAGALLTKPTRLGEAIGSRTAAAIGRPEIWHGANQPHGTPGSEAAAGTAEAKPPPPPQPGDVEQPRSSRRYAKEPVAAEPPAPQVTPFEPDPAVTMAVRGEPIQPRVTEVEPPTQYGPRLDAEFPRVTEIPETAAPVQEPQPQVFEGGEAPPPAPATPREAIAQRPPEETIGGTLRRLMADERGQVPPRKPPPEEVVPEAPKFGARRGFIEEATPTVAAAPEAAATPFPVPTTTIKRDYNDLEGKLANSWTAASDTGRELAKITADIVGDTARIKALSVSNALTRSTGKIDPAFLDQVFQQFRKQNPQVKQIVDERPAPAAPTATSRRQEADYMPLPGATPRVQATALPPVRANQVPTAEQATAARERIAARRQGAEVMPTPRTFDVEGAALPDKSTAALTARGFTPEQISQFTPEQRLEILQKREGEIGSGPKGDEILRQEAEVRASPATEATVRPDWTNLYGIYKDAEGNWQGSIRLYRGEGGTGAGLAEQAAQPGSAMTGGWFTSDLAKAKQYGDVKYIDATADDLRHFAQGHGGADEFVTSNPKFRTQARPLQPAPAVSAWMPTPTGGGKPRGRPNANVPPATAATTSGVPPGAAVGAGGAPPVTPTPPAAATTPTPPTPPPARPVLRAAHAKDLAEGLWPAIRRVFAPEASPSGRVGMDVFREHKGEAVQMKEVQLARFGDAMHYATNQMSDMDQRKLVNYIEGGQHLNTPGHAIHDPNWQPPPTIRRVADQLKRGYADYEHVLSQLPQSAQANFLQDYLTHMYKNPDPLLERISGGGNFGSLKKRVHETYEHARAAGVEPLTNNPIEIFTRYAMGAERAITKQKTINDLETRGYLGWFKPKSVGATGSPEPLAKGAPPEGYAPVPSFVNKQGATAYVPRDMAYMLNHQFGPTFQSPAGEKIMDSVRRFKNFTTNLELGMSLYHPFTVGFETIASGVSRSFAEAGSRPDQIARAAKTFIKAWGEPISNVPLGKEWIERYTDKRTSSAEQQRILDAMKAADIRPVGIGHTMEYDMTSSARKSMGELGSLWTSYKRGSLEREFKGALQDIMGGDWKQGLTLVPNVAARILRTAAQPIFETYIPRLKIASTVLDLQAYVAANPTATKEQLAAVARKTSDSIDNRMGEMVTDHIGMNKAWKAAAFTSMRSFSFTIGGPFREIGGGTISGVKGAVSGENRLSMSSGAYDPKVAYSIAFPFTMVALASMWNYMRTGEWPQDWRDTVVPRTGGEVMSGGQLVQERVLLPGYHKDFLGYAFHPADEVKAKMAGVWGAFYEQITGKDYRGDPIAPPAKSAGLGANIAGRAEHLAGRLAPLSSKQLSEQPKEGSNISLLERGFGFRAPGAYIQNPERIAQVKDIVEQKAWRTRERHENADRAARGLPPLPPRQFREVAGG